MLFYGCFLVMLLLLLRLLVFGSFRSLFERRINWSGFFGIGLIGSRIVSWSMESSLVLIQSDISELRTYNGQLSGYSYTSKLVPIRLVEVIYRFCLERLLEMFQKIILFQHG